MQVSTPNPRNCGGARRKTASFLSPQGGLEKWSMGNDACCPRTWYEGRRETEARPPHVRVIHFSPPRFSIPFPRRLHLVLPRLPSSLCPSRFVFVCLSYPPSSVRAHECRPSILTVELPPYHPRTPAASTARRMGEGARRVVGWGRWQRAGKRTNFPSRFPGRFSRLILELLAMITPTRRWKRWAKRLEF